MTRRAVQRALGAMEARDWLEYLAECRRRDRKPGEPRVVFTSLARYDQDEPGYPLGKGFPQGRTLRLDGESHREAWARTLRSDPCAYCGRQGVSLGCAFTPSGTLDHIEPQARPSRHLGGTHSWLNYTGACASCNTGKADGDLLGYMLARRGVRRPRPSPKSVPDHTPCSDRWWIKEQFRRSAEAA